MKYKNIRFVFFLVVAIYFLPIKNYAQTSFYIKEKSGNKTSILFDKIDKLTISNGNIIVNKYSGNNNIVAINNVRYLSFTDFSVNIEELFSNNKSNFIIFPNPVIDEFSIFYQSNEIESFNVSIVNIQGKILFQQIHNSVIGVNSLTIDVSNLSKGIYFCRKQTSNKIDVQKFIKY